MTAVKIRCNGNRFFHILLFPPCSVPFVLSNVVDETPEQCENNKKQSISKAPRPLAPRPLAPVPPCRAHPCRAQFAGSMPVSRCGRARCPHRAAAPQRGARLGIPRHCPFLVVRSRGRAHHPRPVAVRHPSCGMAVGRDAWPPDSRLAPYRQYQRYFRAAITHKHYPCGMAVRTVAGAPGRPDDAQVGLNGTK